MPTTGAASGASTIRRVTDQQQRVPNNNLGKNEFLKILVAQLSNQDPMSPTTDTEFIGQMAQFSTLEQMQTLNKTYEIQHAQSLIGKFVMAEIPPSADTGGRIESVNGLVEGITMEAGITYLTIGTKKVPITGVQAIIDTAQYSSAMGDMLSGASLLGKHVVAQIPNSTGDGTERITGQVDKVIVKEGWLYAVVGDKHIPLDSILEISTTAAQPEEPTPPPQEGEPPEAGEGEAADIPEQP